MGWARNTFPLYTTVRQSEGRVFSGHGVLCEVSSKDMEAGSSAEE